MGGNQIKMLLLDTKILVTPMASKNIITTYMYPRKKDTHQYLSPNQCHSKSQTKNIPIGVTDRITRNCLDNIMNGITYREGLIEYKA